MFVFPVHLIATPVAVTTIASGKISIGMISSIFATNLTILSITQYLNADKVKMVYEKLYSMFDPISAAVSAMGFAAHAGSRVRQLIGIGSQKRSSYWTQ
jgi:hypothetical protein